MDDARVAKLVSTQDEQVVTSMLSMANAAGGLGPEQVRVDTRDECAENEGDEGEGEGETAGETAGEGKGETAGEGETAGASQEA